MIRKSYSILIISTLNQILNIDSFRNIIDSPGSWQKNATENIVSELIYGLSRNASLSPRKFRRNIYIPTFKLIITLPECGYTCYLGKSIRTALYQWYTTVNSLWRLIGISYRFSSPFLFCFKASYDCVHIHIYRTRTLDRQFIYSTLRRPARYCAKKLSISCTTVYKLGTLFLWMLSIT